MLCRRLRGDITPEEVHDFAKRYDISDMRENLKQPSEGPTDATDALETSDVSGGPQPEPGLYLPAEAPFAIHHSQAYRRGQCRQMGTRDGSVGPAARGRHWKS